MYYVRAQEQSLTETIGQDHAEHAPLPPCSRSIARAECIRLPRGADHSRDECRAKGVGGSVWKFEGWEMWGRALSGRAGTKAPR